MHLKGMFAIAIDYLYKTILWMCILQESFWTHKLFFQYSFKKWTIILSF